MFFVFPFFLPLPSGDDLRNPDWMTRLTCNYLNASIEASVPFLITQETSNRSEAFFSQVCNSKLKASGCVTRDQVGGQ